MHFVQLIVFFAEYDTEEKIINFITENKNLLSVDDLYSTKIHNNIMFTAEDRDTIRQIENALFLIWRQKYVKKSERDVTSWVSQLMVKV